MLSDCDDDEDHGAWSCEVSSILGVDGGRDERLWEFCS